MPTLHAGTLLQSRNLSCKLYVFIKVFISQKKYGIYNSEGWQDLLIYNKVSSGPCKTILLQVFQNLTDPKGITLIYR